MSFTAYDVTHWWQKFCDISFTFVRLALHIGKPKLSGATHERPGKQESRKEVPSKNT